MRVIIAGSRDFDNYVLLKSVCDSIIGLLRLWNESFNRESVVIISGTARGADKLGERYADDRKYSIERHPADWDKYGKRAGYVRNEEMALCSDVLIAFWDGKSNGTKHMIDLANKHRLLSFTILYGE